MFWVRTDYPVRLNAGYPVLLSADWPPYASAAAAAPGAQLVDLSEAPPVAPPRQKRVNPFHQTVAPAAARCATFRELHDEVGRVIQYDRANWWSQHGRQLAASEPPLIDL